MTRVQIVLAGLLAVLVALDLATAPRAASRATGGPLFPQFAPDRAARVLLTTSEGERLEVVRGTREWKLPEAFGFAADDWLLGELLNGMAGLQQGDLVSEAPSDPADFGFGPATDAGPPQRGLRVEVEDAAGARIAIYDQGEQRARAGGIEGVYLRLPGETSVYRATLLPRLSNRLENWLATRVAELEPERVRGLSLEFGGERTERFARAEIGSWTRAGGEAPELALDRVIAAMGALYHSGVASASIDEDQGLRPPKLAVELELAASVDGGEDAATVRLEIGAENGTETFVHYDAWPIPWVVRVRTRSLEKLLAAALEVFAEAELLDPGALEQGPR